MAAEPNERPETALLWRGGGVDFPEREDGGVVRKREVEEGDQRAGRILFAGEVTDEARLRFLPAPVSRPSG